MIYKPTNIKIGENDEKIHVSIVFTTTIGLF